MRFSPTPWLIAAFAFVVLGFSRGLHSSFGVFNVALLDTFGWSRGATAGIFSIVLAVDALLSPAAGYLLDRYGTRNISIAGCLVLVVGLFLSSQVSALWELYICFGLILATGFTLTGMVPHIFLVSEWFSEKRASAIGVVYAGSYDNNIYALDVANGALRWKFPTGNDVTSSPAVKNVSYRWSLSPDMAVTNWDNDIGNYLYYNRLDPVIFADGFRVRRPVVVERDRARGRAPPRGHDRGRLTLPGAGATLPALYRRSRGE